MLPIGRRAVGVVYSVDYQYIITENTIMLFNRLILKHYGILSYVAPLGLAWWGSSLIFVGFHPTLVYVAPSGLALYADSYIITLT